MSRIGASLSGTELLLLNRLSQARTAATVNNLRLATGEKINTPSDDPTAFVALSGFRSRLATVKKTAANVTAATSIVSQTQLALDQVRTELNTIRSKLLEDEDGALSGAERAENQSAIDAALDSINSLAATDIDGQRLLDGSADFRTSGRNPDQVRRVTVLSAGPATLQAAAQQAEITYQGANGLAVDASNITIEGNIGQATFDIATTDSLAEIAGTINTSSGSTGVVAEAKGDVLSLRSAKSGAEQFVRVTTNSGDELTLTGADNTGTARGTAAQLAPAPAIAGRVDQAATKAFLKHEAGGATISQDANFTVSGRRGSATIDVLASENLSLDDFAARLNQQSHKTGVLATVSGTDIELRSVDFGTQSTIDISINSGSFATLDADGEAAASAAGTNAVATINGRKHSGNTAATAAQLTHHTAAGVLTSDAQFELTGPSGSALITIDVDSDDSLTNLRSQINDAAVGVTAEVVGQDLVITSDTTGSDATIELRVLSGTFAIDGGNGDGTAAGTDAVTDAVNVDGNRFTLTENGLHAVIELADGFSGQFNTISIDGGGRQFALHADLQRRSTLAFGGVQTGQFLGTSGSLESLRTGGSAAGLGDNTSAALRIVDEALSRLGSIEGRVDGFANSTIDSAAALSTAFEDELEGTIESINAVNQDEETLLLAKNEALISNTLSSLAVLDQQRLRIVELIQNIAGL